MGFPFSDPCVIHCERPKKNMVFLLHFCCVLRKYSVDFCCIFGQNLNNYYEITYSLFYCAKYLKKIQEFFYDIKFSMVSTITLRKNLIKPSTSVPTGPVVFLFQTWGENPTKSGFLAFQNYGFPLFIGYWFIVFQISKFVRSHTYTTLFLQDYHSHISSE